MITKWIIDMDLAVDNDEGETEYVFLSDGESTFQIDREEFFKVVEKMKHNSLPAVKSQSEP